MASSSQARGQDDMGSPGLCLGKGPHPQRMPGKKAWTQRLTVISGEAQEAHPHKTPKAFPNNLQLFLP